MEPALSVALLGLLFGIQHATDPDHVVAVATILSRRPRFSSSVLIGALWGAGHTATIFAVGSLMIVLNLTISERVGLSLELAVAAMLIVLGVGRLIATFRTADAVHPERLLASHEHSHGEAFHAHFHRHGPVAHAHPHLHPSGRLLEALREVGIWQGARSVAVGVVHGLAGSAAVALLVLSTIRDPYWAVAYLLVFGVGTILGMIGLTVAMTWPFMLTAPRFVRLNRALAYGTGLASASVGLLLAYQIAAAGVLR